MTFEEFLRKVADKIGAKNAFDLARDSRIKVLERVLIEKLNVSEEDIESIAEKELETLAEQILKMPPLPK